MNYEEIFQKIYSILEISGVNIGIITWGRNCTFRARGDHFIRFTDDFREVVTETILLSSCDVVKKIVLLLHEKGHSMAWHNMSPQERMLICRFRDANVLNIIEWEEKAWDVCWNEAVQFGLHKDKNFLKVFFEEKKFGLDSYHEILQKTVKVKE